MRAAAPQRPPPEAPTRATPRGATSPRKRAEVRIAERRKWIVSWLSWRICFHGRGGMSD